MQQKAKSRLEHENELAITRLQVQEQAMNLISEEIHDHVGQLLSITKKYIAAAEAGAVESNIKEPLAKAGNMLAKAIHEIRHISHSLNNELIREKGFLPLVQNDLEHLTDAAQIKGILKIEGVPFNLNHEQELLIYRMIQEAMQNIVKHAKATQVLIAFSFTEKDLTIRIEDNGTGFDIEAARQKESIGFKNIYNRAEILKGAINISSQNGQGTKIYVKIPFYKTYGNKNSRG